MSGEKLASVFGAKIVELENLLCKSQQLAAVRLDRIKELEKQLESGKEIVVEFEILKKEMRELEILYSNIISEKKELEIENLEIIELRKKCLIDKRNAKMFEQMYLELLQN